MDKGELAAPGIRKNPPSASVAEDPTPEAKKTCLRDDDVFIDDDDDDDDDHPVHLATNKKSSLSVAENSALFFDHSLNNSPTHNTNISEPSNNGNNDKISESSAASSLSAAANSAPLNNSPTHNTSPKMSDDSNNNISEPSNNGNNDKISESLVVIDQGETSDSPAPPAPAANTSSDKDGNSPASSNNNLARVPTTGVTCPPQQEVPSRDNEQVAALFHAAFPVDKDYDSRRALYTDVVDFGNKNFFSVRNEGRRSIKCSRASNSNSRKKDAKEKTVSTKEFAVASDCPVEVRFTLRKIDNGRVKISFCNGLHNHPLDVPNASISQRLAGRDIESVLPLIAPQFAPHLKDGGKLNISLARNIIKAHLHANVDISAQSILTIVKAVQKYIKSEKFGGLPAIDSKGMLSQFSTYVASDDATEQCHEILENVMTNSSGETSWKVLQLLEALKVNDPHEFDFRIHKDLAGNIDAFTWQTGVNRGAFRLFGDAIFLDARKKETMNELGMKYMTLVVIDANNKFWPISHSFVFEEDHTLYEFACKSTLEMTPGRTKESVLLGYGDMFFEPDRVKGWFPNIRMMIDSYHLIYAKSGQSILAKEFGPAMWSALRPHFVKALEADTKADFIVSVSNINVLDIKSQTHTILSTSFVNLEAY
jgi:hypothetical protein